MTPNLFLSRVRLRKDAPSAALAEVLLPLDIDRRVTVSHKLLWTLFSDGPDRARDFLWREADKGVFYLLSARSPNDAHSLFDIDPPKAFAPSLSIGDRLLFSLRANPTVSRKRVGKRGQRSDVVMNEISALPQDERAKARPRAIQDAGAAWLRRQGERAGFTVDSVCVDGYRVLRPPHGKNSMRIATVDFDGVLRVTDVEAFASTLSKGFGRAKAYGCGLMLIRRA